MSDYEIANNHDFPGHIINRLGRGLAGGEDPEIPNPFKKAGKTLWEIYDYKHTEMRFDQIDKGINEILNQINQLQNDIITLAQDVGLTASDIQQQISTMGANEYLDDISVVMDPSTPYITFGWFTNAATNFQSSGDTVQFKNDTAGLQVFAYNITHRNSGFDLIDYYSQLSTLIYPKTGPSPDNILTNYASWLIQHTPGLTDTSSLMSCYMLLENYFVTIINYQFQAALIQSNAYNYFDSAGNDAKNFYTGTFTVDIRHEVDVFLETVEFMAINLSDYRHFEKWEADYPSRQSGLAPDFLFTHILARSQFIANLIYDGLGLSYPVMCGTIITPNKYSNEYGSVVDSIALSANGKQLTSTAKVLQSQFPYTYWTNIPNNVTCYPDNNWNIYRFGKMGVEDQGWPTTAVALQVIDNGDGYYPWSHYQPCQGNVTPLYYNPQNPSQTSTSYNTTCSVQFAYFAARWNWGYQFITMRGDYYLRPQYLDVQHENSNFGCDPYFSPPGAATSDKNGSVYQHSNSQGFNWTHSNLGGCSFSNTCVNTDHYYFAADVLYCDITTSNDVPPIGGKLEMWGMSSAQYTGQSGLMKVFLGSGINSFENICQVTVVRSTQDIVNSQFGNAGSWVNSTNSVYVDAGKAYQPSMEVYYQAYNPYAVPVAFATYNMMQVVYDGTYNIFE